MEKEIHFMIDTADVTTYTTYAATQKLLSQGVDVIYTTQMALLSFDLIEKGYRIFIHKNTYEHEIKLGHNYFTPKELRKEHNLFKLWASGSFDFGNTHDSL